MSSLIGAYFFMFLGLFYIALIVGMFFMWYFIIKKAIIKGINESKLVKNSLEHDREIYLLKQELKGLKTAQQLTDTPKEEQVEKVEEISIKEEVPKEEIGEKGDREYDESSN